MVDGMASSCTFSFPLQTAPGGGTVAPSCTGGVQLDVQPATNCVETQINGATTLRCDPIPGQFRESLTVHGAPSRIDVRQFLDEVLILDETVMPSYTTWHPNGPDCDPACRQAKASWTLQ